MATRASIILDSLADLPDNVITQQRHLNALSVGKWRKRFAKDSIGGLYNSSRSGKSQIYPKDLTRKRVLETLAKKSPHGFLCGAVVPWPGHWVFLMIRFVEYCALGIFNWRAAHVMYQYR